MNAEKKKTIWIIGADGQLGRSFRRLAPQREQYDFHFTGQRETDICKPKDIARFLHEHTVDICINCAAYTDVDGAESDEEKAFAVNAGGVKHLLDALPEEVFFIHYSTDYVFDGMLNRPLREDDPVSPASVYGQSKLEGEHKILGRDRKALIIRTSWLYSPFGDNFVKTMLRLSTEHERLKVVSDQIGSPTHALDLAGASLRLIDETDALKRDDPFVLHYSNSGVASWYDFAQAIFEICNINIPVEAVGTDAFPRPAPRPSYSVLDSSRIHVLLGETSPWWKHSLEVCLELMRENDPELFPGDN